MTTNPATLLTSLLAVRTARTFAHARRAVLVATVAPTRPVIVRRHNAWAAAEDTLRAAAIRAHAAGIPVVLVALTAAVPRATVERWIEAAS